jgi:hypothetical protein
MKLISKVCPVLLAWGWKDWAAQLDTWAGAELWDETLVAVCLSVAVGVIHTLPAYIKAKKGVTAGGSEDTLVRRILIVPSSLMLTLGYVWSMVGNWFVNKVQDLTMAADLQDTGLFAHKFLVQTVYTLFIGVVIALVSLQVIKADTESKGASSDHHWDGPAQTALSDVALSTMSFVYAWTVLHSCDDFGFGLMFNCTSSLTCSYQSNFVYSGCVTICFATCATLLNLWQQFQKGPSHKTVLGLQISAMVLTVGWAWMNLYTVFMSSITRNMEAGTSVVVYLLVLVFIFMSTSTVMFVLQSIQRDLTARSKQRTEALENIGTPSRLQGEPEDMFQNKCSEIKARHSNTSCDARSWLAEGLEIKDKSPRDGSLPEGAV